MSVARSQASTSIPPELCGEVSGKIDTSGDRFHLARAPDVIKAFDPLGVLPPLPKDTWSPLARLGATGPPTVAPTPADGTDVTAHSEQEHHHDVHTSTATGVKATIPPTLLSTQIQGTRTARPRWHRGTQDETWPQHIAPADREAKRSTPVASLRYKGNYSHRIRRKTAAPKATFLLFPFIFPHFIFLP
jgi:hypothetical protein